MTSKAPFSTVIRLVDIALDCGVITKDAYDRAPGGNFGKVFFGRYRGVRVAVKIMVPKPGVDPKDADIVFKKEADNLIAVLDAVSRARLRLNLGAQLSEDCSFTEEHRRCTEPHDLRGHRHVVLVYGIGSEPDPAAVAPGLPRGPAHFIVMEELTGGTLDSPPNSIDALLRVTAELACGLAMLAAAHVVHADLKVCYGISDDGLPGLLSIALTTAGMQHHFSYARRRSRAFGLWCGSNCKFRSGCCSLQRSSGRHQDYFGARTVRRRE